MWTVIKKLDWTASLCSNPRILEIYYFIDQDSITEAQKHFSSHVNIKLTPGSRFVPCFYNWLLPFS